MQEYWGQKLFFVLSNPQHYSLWRRGKNLLKKVLRVNQVRRQLVYGGHMGVDEKYTPFVQKQVEQILQDKSFGIVICAYIFYSRILESFDHRTLKIIDTIDAQSIRDRRFLQNVFHTSPRQEAKALNRADIVMAIQSREKSYFQTLTRRKVILLGHPVTLRPKSLYQNIRRRLVFIGSAYESNVMAMEYFVNEVFPLVSDEFPDTRLIIAGRVCEKIGKYANCTKLGQVEDIASLYEQADVAINPIQAGRGLKIKNIEALGYAMPLVTTTVGAEGLEAGIGKAFLAADTPAEFARCICLLFSDQNLYRSVSASAYAFAEQYNKGAYEELNQELNSLSE